MVCPVETRQRDLFPLPYVPYERCRQAGLSRGTRQRIARSFAKVNEVNDVISSPNSLYEGGAVFLQNFLLCSEWWSNVFLYSN